MMNTALSSVMVYALLPVAAIIATGIVTALHPPGPSLRSYLQHFAAGVLFSVISVEFLPDMIRERQPVPVILGFALGLSVMLGIRSSKKRFMQTEEGRSERLANLIAAVGGYLLIVGLLIGIGFGAGKVEGKLLALALTIEIFYLGVTTASALSQAGIKRSGVILTLLLLSPLILIGGAAGAILLLGLLSLAIDIVLSFGLAALLFLATEELLLEAHNEPEMPLATATFFAGFLLFLVFSLYSLKR